ncbi:MAG: helix-turn-helix transcriptional regulator [Thermoleophilia bacterium]
MHRPGLASRVDLVERDGELAELDALLSAAGAGAGALLMLEGPAGQGKTALLRELRARGRERATKVLTAVGAPLERDFPFGVVRQLFEAELRGSDPQRSELLLRGAASLAAGVFETTPDPGSTDVSLAQLNGLFWFTVNLSEEQPLLLVIDDAHWADAPSLRFLDVLARRLEDLPIAVALAARPAEPGTEQDLLDALALSPDTHLLRPGALSAAAVKSLLQAALGGEVHERFAAVCAELTGGNPLFVGELARTLQAEGFTGAESQIDAARAAVPPSIARSVVGRLRRLATPALALVRAVAVLGERAETRHVAALAELDPVSFASAHAEAAGAGLLDADRPRFAHPLVAEAVRSELPAFECGVLHRRAAELLAGDGADPDAVAAHLMASEPAGDPQVARRLAAAGRRALAGGAPDAAARLLGRALREPPERDERAAVLLDLGIAESRLGSAEGLRHLDEAAAEGGRVVRARAILARAGGSVLRAHDPEAIGALRELLDAPGELSDHLVCRIECGLLNLLPYEETLQDEYVRRLEAGAGADRAAALAHLAFLRAITGAAKAEVCELARRALGEDRIRAEFEMESSAPYYAIEALHLVEASTEAAAALRTARVAAQRSGSPLAIAWFAHTETAWQRFFGSLPEAVSQLQAAVELLKSTDARRGSIGIIAALAGALADQARFEQAEAVLAQVGDRDDANAGMIGLPVVAGRVHLARGRPHEALGEFDRQLAFERPRGWRLTPREMTRSLRVAALAATGRVDDAHAAAREEVALALERGVHGHEARARLALAALLDRADAPAELQRAVDAARRSPSRLVQAEALGALGGAQRRGNQRADARETLRQARELAHGCGATGLEQRIHEELVVAGARPQRIALAGVESLTAAERRVAELAADGLRNREIAETLFVTLKTVEVHLGRAYAKLDIRGRSQLPAALGLEVGSAG